MYSELESENKSIKVAHGAMRFLLLIWLFNAFYSEKRPCLPCLCLIWLGLRTAKPLSLLRIFCLILLRLWAMVVCAPALSNSLISTAVVTFREHHTWSTCSWAWQKRGCQSLSLLASVSFFHVKGPLCNICVASMRCQSRCPAPFRLNWGAPDHMRPVGMTSPGNLASDLEDGSHLCWLCVAVAHQGSWSHFLLPRLFHPRTHCATNFFNSVGSVLFLRMDLVGFCYQQV